MGHICLPRQAMPEGIIFFVLIELLTLSDVAARFIEHSTARQNAQCCRAYKRGILPRQRAFGDLAEEDI